MSEVVGLCGGRVGRPSVATRVSVMLCGPGSTAPVSNAVTGPVRRSFSREGGREQQPLFVAVAATATLNEFCLNAVEVNGDAAAKRDIEVLERNGRQVCSMQPCGRLCRDWTEL